MKLLIVDDEVQIRSVLREYALMENYEVKEASNGIEAIDLCKNEDFDLIIMDVMMPRLDGFSTVKEIKKFKDIPVLMLSARGEEYDKLFGFEIGIDDYVVKPFSPKEVMLRIQAILKRSQKSKVEERFVYKDLEIDYLGRNVFINKKKILLTPKEYELLFYLVKNKGIALSRDKILNDVWGYDFFGDDRTVDTHIKMLRCSLEEYRDCFITIRGVGYKFDTEK